MRATLLSVLIYLGFQLSVSAQKDAQEYSDLYFYQINSSDGLSNNVINDITQDSLGFLWIATYDGLNRYDGMQFLKFRKNIADEKTGVSNNYIQELQLLDNNRLLIATDAGLNIYDLTTETFKVLTTTEGLLNNSVSALTLNEQQQPIIGTYRGGIQYLSSLAFETIGLSKDGEALSSNEISSIAAQGDSILWVGTYDKGLNKITREQGIYTSEVVDIPQLKNATVYQVYIDRAQNLWGATNRGLVVITPTGNYKFLSKENTSTSGLSDSDILSIVDDQQGNLFVGTRYGGLNILNKRSLLTENIPLDIQWYQPTSDGASVFDRSVTSLFIDKDQGLWIGTPTGLNYTNLKGEFAKTISENGSYPYAISDDRVSAIAVKSNTQVWVGTDGEGLDLYDLNTGKLKTFSSSSTSANPLSGNSILALLPDGDEHIWVGTYQKGLNYLNHKTGESTYFLQGSQQDGNDVRTLFRSKNGTLWVGTNRGGLFKYDDSLEDFIYVSDLEKLDIRDIEEHDGYLWLATFGSGLIRYNPSDGSAIYYNSDNIKNLNTNIFFTLEIVDDSTILLGTRYNGLKIFDPKNETVKSYSENDGLSNNTINSLLLQQDQFVWIGTYTGIDRFDLKNNVFKNFTALRNVQNEGVGPIASTTDGKVFVGGLKGLQVIDVSELERLEGDQNIVFKQLNVLNKVITPEENSVLQKAITYQDALEFDYFQNAFSIHFTALKYPLGNTLSYSYKLENYNDFWIDTQEGIANFTGVPPGDYILKVKTESSSGKEILKTLAITVHPPFWKTPLAYVIYILALVLIIYLISRYFSERLKLKNRLILEQQQRQLEHELNEERLRFFTAFSHELKTPLTLILAPLDNLITDANNRSLKKQLNIINRNAKKLSAAINKLLEFRKSEEGLSRLNLSDHNLSANLKKWVKNYAPLAIDKNITIRTFIEESEQRYLFDIEKLKVIINNLLSNAIKYCDDDGSIEVHLYINKYTLDIAVSDNGAGIAPQELEEIFSWYYRSETAIQKSGTGIGLALSKRFAELHNGSLKVTSTPHVKTTFMVEIPKLIPEAETISTATAKEETSLEAKDLHLTTEVVNAEKDNTKSIASAENRALVMVIDDNPDILNFLDEILKGDYDLVFANNGEEGIKKAQKFVPDLIISDIMMPKKTGIDLCRALKNDLATSHIPIILLTAKGNLESLKTGYEEGADDYISKPFQPQLLKTRISNLLRNREAVQRFLQTKEMKQQPEENNSPALNKEKEFLAKLDAIIHANIGSENENVFDIAKELGMSRTSLYRKLKSITGYSINEYTRNLKLEKAADLIENQEYSVSQAAYEVGFNSPKYFRKIFKEMYGKLPSEFKS
ncbi:MAG TPA: hybrid sensor histidine kinase/response regulator [Leeuwenhoekiella sp.]|nr:hybrid sensor histidine kinase/response regulator [Leeuwenhoekiella sp.]